MNPGVVCTIAAVNYLPFVRILSQSLLKHNPNVHLKVLLVAEEEYCAAFAKEGFDVLRISALSIPSLHDIMQQYQIKQTCAALKPALLRHMIEKGYSHVLFLDPDILVTASLATIFKIVRQHALTLTPHVHSMDDRARAGNLDRAIRLAGTFNAGFIGVGNTPDTRRFLTWWEERLRTHCIEAPWAGVYFDQRWLDHALGFVEDVYILRDPGCNVAYWNIGDFSWRVSGNVFYVNDQPLRFFHFSGFDPGEPAMISKFLPGFKTNQLGPLEKLFNQYASMLKNVDHGQVEV